MKSPKWFNKASCKGLDTSLFFGEGHDVGVTTAKEVCADCPVRIECLDYAVELKEYDFGIWGGVAPQNRRPGVIEKTRKRVQYEMRRQEIINTMDGANLRNALAKLAKNKQERKLNRRKFISFSSSALVAAPLLTISEISRLGKKPIPEIPVGKPGQILTSESWNEVVDRLNVISEQVL